jgi:hypothetical protein
VDLQRRMGETPQIQKNVEKVKGSEYFPNALYILRQTEN